MLSDHLWWCLDCTAIINLDRHGRCEICDSDAVVHAEHQYLEPAPEDKLVAILEGLWRL